jgi:hypothetical protein
MGLLGVLRAAFMQVQAPSLRLLCGYRRKRRRRRRRRRW